MTYPYDVTNNPLWIDPTKKDKNTKDSSAKITQTQDVIPFVTNPAQTPAVKSVVSNNLPLVTKKIDNNIGTSVERSSVSPKPQTDNDVPFKKTGESAPERMDRFYAGRYSKANEDEKMKYIGKYATEYLKRLPGKTEEEKSQLLCDDLKKMLYNTRNIEDKKILIKAIKYFGKEDQFNAAKIAMFSGDDEQNDIGQVTVAGEIQNYDESVQIGTSQLVADTKNVKAIIIAASHTPELASKNQTPAVAIYEKADVSDKSKVEIDKTIIDRFGKYAKENQTDIYKIMSDSKFSEIVEYAASNIWHLDKDNQKSAVQITIETGNEKAINASAAQFAKYDKDVQTDIKSEFENTNYDSAKKTLAEAEAKAEAEKIAEAQSKEAIENEQNSTASNAKATTKIDAVVEIIQNKDTNALKDSVKKMSDTDKEKLLNLYPNNVDIISSILESSSGMLCLKAMDALSKLDERTQRTIVQSLNKNHSNVISKDIALYSSNVQKVFIEDTKTSDLGSINRNMLSSLAKAKYDELKMG